MLFFHLLPYAFLFSSLFVPIPLHSSQANTILRRRTLRHGRSCSSSPVRPRLHTAVLPKGGSTLGAGALADGRKEGEAELAQVDLRALSHAQRERLVERALETLDQDNEAVGLAVPAVEVRFEDVHVEAGVYVGTRALPTLLNFTRNSLAAALRSLRVVPDSRRPYPILHGCSGVLRPGRMTLLLGPPGAGKSTLMQTLAGCHDKSLKVSGSVTYNGHALNEFVPERTAVYVPQNDEHIGEMTVRETLDFSARLQGPGLRKDLVEELERREAEQGIVPDPTMDAIMKAMALEGNPTNVITDYVLKILPHLSFSPTSASPPPHLLPTSDSPPPQLLPHLIFSPTSSSPHLIFSPTSSSPPPHLLPHLIFSPTSSSPPPHLLPTLFSALGLDIWSDSTSVVVQPDICAATVILGLDICADTVVGNDMLRGISGGQKKRVTTGVSLVGPKQVLLMDEISTGLDSSTTFLITRCLRHLTHLHAATTLVALLQPAPETYELFDDVLLLSEGHVVFHGPREQVVPFFNQLGFECPERKGEADFLQEVTSMKDQGQYWKAGAGGGSQPYHYVPAQAFEAAFKETQIGKATAAHLSPHTLPTPAILLPQFSNPHPSFPRSSFPNLHSPPRPPPGALSKRKEPPRRARSQAQRAAHLGDVPRGLRARVAPHEAQRIPLRAQTIQIILIALVTMTVFFRTTLDISLQDGNYYLGAMFFGLIMMLFNGFTELTLLVMRLPIFYRQRDTFLYPAWAWEVPMELLSLPFSAWASIIWTAVTYYVIGFAPEPGRFFMQMLLFFLIHQVAISLFRLIGALGRSMVVSNTFGSFALILLFLLGGFVLAKGDIHNVWIWAYWISPLMYGQNALAVNEFLAPRWNVGLLESRSSFSTLPASLPSPVPARTPVQSAGPLFPPTATMGQVLLESRSLPTDDRWLGIGVAALIAFIILFNLLTILALAYLDPLSHSTAPLHCLADPLLPLYRPSLHPAHLCIGAAWGRPQPVVSEEQLETKHAARTGEVLGTAGGSRKRSTRQGKGTSSALDRYCTSHTASRARVHRRQARHGAAVRRRTRSPSTTSTTSSTCPPRCALRAPPPDARLQLLRNVSGRLPPQGADGAGGRVGRGQDDADGRAGGAEDRGVHRGGRARVRASPRCTRRLPRVAGYCEQSDIHTPQVTVHESLLFSAWLRLPADVDVEVREEFVEEVMELVELDSLRDAMVGLPGVNGLSTEQRKRLTIAVELVANPSIIFLDEPTSGLDARAAAIVMRTVRNTVDTGRTVVCTIHQPSIDIFEAFDELLLMKRGGEVIYMGPLGTDSRLMIDYFQAIPGVPPIRAGYNPATWMLDISTPAMAEKLNVDFAEIFRKSDQFRRNEELIESLKTPPPGQQDLAFATKFSTSYPSQFVANLWKRSRMYWRAPDYNAVRYFFCVIMALLIGGVFFGLGKQRSTQQQLLNVMGAMYTASLFMGWNNAASVQPIVAIERTVFYRERSAGLYGAVPYALAQGGDRAGRRDDTTAGARGDPGPNGAGVSGGGVWLPALMARLCCACQHRIHHPLFTVFAYALKKLNFQNR
ncbi:unnamed protein product [Closterium sp. NIES-64]|nr:unnamed protein product [Closterium sp. NIES-64]